jgi:short-subunit dehydrogenase
MDGPGYALVTGASQGIGRAIAVELARWEIPLVLVARDLDRLTSLAFDLEACYGVKCCVLKADLSEVDAAEKIHETTKKAGITVDILVNNAGVAYEGLSVDMDTTEVERMVIVNAMTYAKLGNLYGQNMKKRGRGRILMVSSMAGLTSSSPYTALYGATKAFGKSLALSMAKELEPYGVGVTCIMPGAVTNTEFRNRSGTGRALCWYLPFYPRPAEVVAHLGVMSLLDGDTQVIPGWQNRVFVKLLQPILPQRVETMCVQAAWAPFHLRLPGFLRKGNDQPGKDPQNSTASALQDDSASPSAGIYLDLKPRYSMQRPPRLLKLPQPQQLEPPTVESATVEIGYEPDIAEKASEEPVKEENQSSVNTLESSQRKLPGSPPVEEAEVSVKEEQAEEQSNCKTCVGTKWRSQDKSQSWWFDEEDTILSPRLGSIDILEPRKYALQRLKVAKRPKWTIQT